MQIEFPDEKAWFFLAPAGGGVEVICEGTPVTVLTPESPLGAQLVGRQKGDRIMSPKAKILKVE